MWVLAVLAVVVGVGGGWLLSRGRLGEMPELVDDRPQPRLPEGRFTADDVRALRFARTGRGYDRVAVDELLRAAARSLDDPTADPGQLATMSRETRFKVVRGGYQMQQVDAVLDRLSHQWSVDALTSIAPTADAPEPSEPAQRLPDAE